MPYWWKVREELSQTNRLRRSFYELLRDEFDQYMLRYSLIDSYENFLRKQQPYPFVEKRELKPRARLPMQEYECQNAFLVIFMEDSIPSEHKKYIRFLNVNKTTKTNLLASNTLRLSEKFDRNQKYLESVHFYDFLKSLLSVDYALLIQRDPETQTRDRYILSHFHVRIDWPIANAAEDLAQYLRYISKDIYEKGDKYAEDVQKKFFEYYGIPVTVGGRRTAAIVAAQYLKRIPCIATVYVSSSESRALIRISERGLSKAVLVRFQDSEMEQIALENRIGFRTFVKNYVVAKEQRGGICIFQATYAYTNQARPPDDGKLREIKPDLNWLSVGGEYLIPKPGVLRYPPLALNFIYT
ncbi:MAG: hypothetical protein JRH18_16370 [Deltaproteobacteria bacterium]|nr:hypothetical protein [Deltaproteobacteria bacterium]MBW1962636.1 hypothetical protein [Deltaproteobacteria bacterium]MBW1992855.1 hypothetical protein [Deltaproteobacteria bacterium]MBW2153233.1 hypothetical protein [Deltaproteobacteria bacterium]